MTERFRCTLASGLRGDELAGTASTVRAYLLVEYAGPWGVDALRDSRLPEPVKQVLRGAGRQGIRVNLVRRHRATGQEGTRVLTAYADPDRPWLESTVLAEPEAVADLDLVALAQGRSPGLTPTDEPVFAVCTHGRHDACCAELGRPLAGALSEAQPEATWEVSHIGGDRFAGNLLVLPHGLYYGRLDPRAALAVATGHRAGRLDLDHLRGRSSYPMPVQAAEVALRRRLDELGLDALRLVERRLVERRREGTTWQVRFVVGADVWQVRVRSSSDDAERHRLTCRATGDSPVPRHEVLDVRTVTG